MYIQSGSAFFFCIALHLLARVIISAMIERENRVMRAWGEGAENGMSPD